MITKIIPGAAYLFSEKQGEWKEQKKFSYGKPDGSDGFGFGVAVEGGSVLVSAPFDSADGRKKGAVYFINCS